MIVGLTGRMGSGKNEAAKRLAALYPGRVIEVSFAAKLKESVTALLDISLEDIERWKNDPHIRVVVRGSDGYSYADLGFRHFLQRFGTESHRNVFDDDFWLDAALPLDVEYSPDHIYVVTDMRFPNELERVQDLSGITARLVGPVEDEQVTHISEQVLQADYVIDNIARDDGFAALDTQLIALVETNDSRFVAETTGPPKDTPEFGLAPEVWVIFVGA